MPENCTKLLKTCFIGTASPRQPNDKRNVLGACNGKNRAELCEDRVYTAQEYSVCRV